jgi:hypothetical protein
MTPFGGNWKWVTVFTRTNHILRQMNLEDTFPSYFFKINFNIIFSSKIKCQKREHSFYTFQPKMFNRFLALPRVLHDCPFSPLWCDSSSNVWRNVQIMKLLITKFYPIICLCLKSKYSIRLPVLKTVIFI